MAAGSPNALVRERPSISLRFRLLHSKASVRMHCFRGETHSNALASNTHTVNISCFANPRVLRCGMRFDHPIRASAPDPRTSAKTSAGLGAAAAPLSKRPVAPPNPRTPENSVLCFHALAHCPSGLASKFALCFDTLTNRSSRKPPGLIVMQHALCFFHRSGISSHPPVPLRASTARAKMIALTTIRHRLHSLLLPFAPDEPGVSSIQGNHAH